MLVDGVLIPISHLINHTTASQEPRDEVDYWHIELAQHDVPLAEGLPAESYLETGNRGAFSDGTVEALHLSFGRTTENAWTNHACAPPVEGGPRLAVVNGHLPDRADLLRCAVSEAVELIIDSAGVLINATFRGMCRRFGSFQRRAASAVTAACCVRCSDWPGY